MSFSALYVPSLRPSVFTHPTSTQPPLPSPFNLLHLLSSLFPLLLSLSLSLSLPPIWCQLFHLPPLLSSLSPSSSSPLLLLSSPLLFQTSSASSSDSSDSSPSDTLPEDPLQTLAAQLAASEATSAQLKDQLLRALAEQENIRGIASRDISAAKAFSVGKMAKSLLDVSDNLERALAAVPEEMREDREGHGTLAVLYEGISMTASLFQKALNSNSITKFGEVGDSFDPSLHNAMFEYADEEREGGTVGQVVKAGFMLNGRVIRPADVGTVKK